MSAMKEFSVGDRLDFPIGHRLYDPILQFLGALAISSARLLKLPGPPPPPPGYTFEPCTGIGSLLVGLGINVPDEIVLPLLLQNRRPDRVTLWVCKNQMALAPIGPEITTLGTAHRYVVSAVFTNFHEAHKGLLPNDYTLWPVADFGRVVRNAMAHAGRIYFDKPARHAVQWRGLSYDHGDNGKLLSDRLSVADILFLMMEMSEEFDALHLPTP